MAAAVTRPLIVGADVGAVSRAAYEIGGPFLWATCAEHVRPDSPVARVVWATPKRLLPPDLVAAVERLVAP